MSGMRTKMRDKNKNANLAEFIIEEPSQPHKRMLPNAK